MKTDRKLVSAAIAAIVAMAAAAFVLWPRAGVLGKQPGATETICAACGHTEHRTLSAVPDTCGKCGQTQVFPAVACPRCGAACPLRAVAGPQVRGAMLTCGKCGHQFAPGMSQKPGSSQ